jgi:hypothetical protein
VEILLRKLFIMYASFGTRSNLNYLRSSKFQKLAADAGIIDKNISTTKLDLIFASVNKRDPNMSFERFLEALVKIAEVKFGSLPSDAGVKKLLNEFVLPLYSSAD